MPMRIIPVHDHPRISKNLVSGLLGLNHPESKNLRPLGVLGYWTADCEQSGFGTFGTSLLGVEPSVCRRTRFPQIQLGRRVHARMCPSVAPLGMYWPHNACAFGRSWPSGVRDELAGLPMLHRWTASAIPSGPAGGLKS